MLLCQFLVLAITTGNKKVLVVCLAGVLLCQFLVLAGNRQFFCCGGKFFLLWRESFITTGKKVLVVCLAGCAVVSVFDSGDYDSKKKF